MMFVLPTYLSALGLETPTTTTGQKTQVIPTPTVPVEQHRYLASSPHTGQGKREKREGNRREKEERKKQENRRVFH